MESYAPRIEADLRRLVENLHQKKPDSQITGNGTWSNLLWQHSSGADLADSRCSQDTMALCGIDKIVH